MVLFFIIIESQWQQEQCSWGSSGGNTEVLALSAENEFAPTAKTSDVNKYVHLFSLLLHAYSNSVISIITTFILE